MNRKAAVEKIMRAKIMLEGGSNSHVRHSDSCHLEADPDAYSCSCGAEARHASSNAPRVFEAISELDEALEALLG